MSKVKPESIHAISSSVMTVATLCIFAFGAMEYLALKKSRRYEVMKSLGSRFDQDEAILEARAHAAYLYPKDPDDSDPLFRILNFFEEMAPAYEHGIITAEDLHHSFFDPILLYWCGWKDWVPKFRDAQQDESYFRGYENLAEEMKKFNDGKCFDEYKIEKYLEKERRVFKTRELLRRIVLNQRGQERLGLSSIEVIEQLKPHSGGWSLARSSEGREYLIDNSEIVRIEAGGSGNN